MRVTRQAPALEELRLFDACLTLGRIVHSRLPQSIDADSIIGLLDRYSISEALVHDHHARLVHPRADGNRRLLRAIEGVPRLHPVWVIEPPRRPGLDAARALVEEMLAAGVRAARLPMKAAPPIPWIWEDLLVVLEEHRLPCFIDFGGVSTWGSLADSDIDHLRAIASAHPELPLILSNIVGGLGIHYGVLPLLQRAPNVHIDTTGVLEYWRRAAREVGPERVLFATGAPFTDPGIYVSNVQYARRLDAREKRMVSGDNLRRLLGSVR